MKREANGNVRAWIRKAEQDWRAAGLLLRPKRNPIYELVCFHAQQCAEKYLKALLVKRRIYFPKTHNLLELLSLALNADGGLSIIEADVKLLNRYSVDIRYPGAEAQRKEAQDCLKALKRIRARCLEGLMHIKDPT